MWCLHGSRFPRPSVAWVAYASGPYQGRTPSGDPEGQMDPLNEMGNPPYPPGTLLSFSAGSAAMLESGWQRSEWHTYLGDWVFCGREKFLGQPVHHMMGKHDKRPFNVTDPAVRPVNQMLVMGPSSPQDPRSVALNRRLWSWPQSIIRLCCSKLLCLVTVCKKSAILAAI